MFSEVQRGKFIMSLSTGKYEVCMCALGSEHTYAVVTVIN